MEHLLYAREAMYRSCYEHPRKRAAERIFERLIREIAKDKPEIIDELYILTDEEVLCALRLVNLESDTATRLLEQLVSNSDYEVVHQVQAKSSNISDQARVWVKGAAMGKGKQSYVDQPAQWEDAIARSSIGAERGFQVQVIVAPPNAYEQKFDAAVILFKDEKGDYRTKEFFDTASRVKEVLSAMNPARATIKVMCASAIEEAERQRVLTQRLADRDQIESQRKADETALAAMEQRLGEARGESGYRGERLTIIDPAIVPERPSSPNLPLNLAAAMLLGLLLPLVYFTLEMSYQQQRADSRRGEFRAVGESGR